MIIIVDELILFFEIYSFASLCFLNIPIRRASIFPRFATYRFSPYFNLAFEISSLLNDFFDCNCIQLSAANVAIEINDSNINL
ncbi:MAG: hypothetical protein CL623_08080 [Arcobacter sp.]|nr:hypothetical protein [Arcobacter sp.]